MLGKTHMEIKLAFNPDELPLNSEAYRVFRFGGIPLKLWCLYKRNHLTNQYFAPAVDRLIDRFEENEGVPPYSTIKEFIDLLFDCGFRGSLQCFMPMNTKWVMEHWDYFSPSINKQLKIIHSDIVIN